MTIPDEVTREVMTFCISSEQKPPIPPSVTNGFSDIGESSPGGPLSGGLHLSGADVKTIRNSCKEAWANIQRSKAIYREYA